MDNMYDQRQMPHNNEAEQSVLGAIILDPELIGSTPGGITSRVVL